MDSSGEFRLVNALAHKNVVKTLNLLFLPEVRIPFMIMEYVRGRSYDQMERLNDRLVENILFENVFWIFSADYSELKIMIIW